MHSASYWIKQLDLCPHPEGGYYKETYRSSAILAQKALSAEFNGDRACGTAIYYLLEKNDFSSFHRIASDEIWHFYAGDALEIFILNEENKTLDVIRLGNHPENGEVFQAVVPAGFWFGARPASGSRYTLAGCTVAPGFDFNDFEMGQRNQLLQTFPAYHEIITGLTASQ